MSTPIQPRKPGSVPPPPTAQGVGLATAPEHNTGGGEDNQQGAFRLDALAAAGMEPLPDAPKRKIPMQYVLMAGLLLLAAGALLGMRKLGMGPLRSQAGQIDISYDLNKKPDADHQKVLNGLAGKMAQQVPAEQIHKNPFSLADASLATAGPQNNTPAPAGESPEAKAARLAAAKAAADAQAKMGQLQSTLANLKIHGIMTGSTPVARVGDQTVRVGDRLADLFKVTAIRDRAVDLEADDGTAYTVSLDDAPRATPRPGSGTTPKKP